MIFKELKLKGVFIVEIERLEDDRGFFARTWCQNEFKNNGMNSNLVQANISFNMKKGTLRGMHYQIAPGKHLKRGKEPQLNYPAPPAEGADELSVHLIIATPVVGVVVYDIGAGLYQ